MTFDNFQSEVLSCDVGVLLRLERGFYLTRNYSENILLQKLNLFTRRNLRINKEKATILNTGEKKSQQLAAVNIFNYFTGKTKLQLQLQFKKLP